MKYKMAILIFNLFLIINIKGQIPHSFKSQNSKNIYWDKIDDNQRIDTMWRTLIDTGYIKFLAKDSVLLDEKKHNTNIGLLSDREFIELTYSKYDKNKTKWIVKYFRKDSIIEQYYHSDICSCEVSKDSLLIQFGSPLLSTGNEIQFIIENKEIKRLKFYEKYHYRELDPNKISWDDIPNVKSKKSSVSIKDYKIIYKEKPKMELNEFIKGFFELETNPFQARDKSNARDEILECKVEILFVCELKPYLRSYVKQKE